MNHPPPSETALPLLLESRPAALLWVALAAGLIVTAVLAVKYGGAAGLVAVVPAVAFIVTSIYSWFR